MQIQVFKLTLDNHYSEFKEFCIDHWEDHTRTSSRMMNICNLDVNKFFHSAIFCLENNIAPTIVDLVGQRRNTTAHDQTLLIGPEQQSRWSNFQDYLDTAEGGNKAVAPYAILVPISGDVSVIFKEYTNNVLEEGHCSFDPTLVGPLRFELKLDAPYLVSTLNPVDIINHSPHPALYIIYRFVYPKRPYGFYKWLSFIMHNFKRERLKQ